MSLHPPLRVAVVALEPGARKLRDYFWAAAHRADELAAARGYPVPPPLPAPSGRGSAAALEPSAAYVEWANKVREQKTNYVREQLRKGSPARKKVKQARKDARKKASPARKQSLARKDARRKNSPARKQSLASADVKRRLSEHRARESMERFVLSVCDTVLHQFDPDRHHKPALASKLLRRVETDRNAFFENPCYSSLFALPESDLGDARALLKPGPRLAMLVLCKYAIRNTNSQPSPQTHTFHWPYKKKGSGLVTVANGKAAAHPSTSVTPSC